MQTGQSSSLRVDRLALLIGAGLFVLSLLIRLAGIGWGLPNDLRNQSLHPDELVVWSFAQRVEPAKGKFTPGFYNYGTFYLTTLRVASDMVRSYGGGPKDDSEAEFWRYIARCHMAGRVLSALAGAATAWVVFLLLHKRTHWVGGLGAGLAVAFAPAHVVHSRFQTVDVLATLFVALSLLFALKLLPPEGERPVGKRALSLAAWAGLFAGLSAGTKYTGILALVALAVVALVRWRAGERRDAWRPLLVGVGVALLAFLVVTPGALLDSARFMKDFRYEMTHTSTGHGLVFVGTANGFVYHLANLLIGWGPLLTLMGLVGLGRACRRRHGWALALAAFGLAYYLLIGRAEVKFLRYVFPLIPVLAAGFGWLVGQAHVHPQRKWRAVTACGILAVGGFMGGGLMYAVQWTGWMAGEDPRDSAARYLRAPETGVRNVGLVKDPWFWSASIFPDAGTMRPIGPQAWADFFARMDATSRPRAVLHMSADPMARVDFDERLLTEDKPEAVVASSFEFGDVARLMNVPGLPAEAQAEVDRARTFFRRLDRDYTLVQVFGFGGPAVHDLMYIRPEVRVWKRKSDSTKPSTGSSTTSGSSVGPARTP